MAGNWAEGVLPLALCKAGWLKPRGGEPNHTDTHTHTSHDSSGKSFAPKAEQTQRGFDILEALPGAFNAHSQCRAQATR